MENPAISVIIPTFNRFEFLLNALESIQTQTFQDFEIIIVNDGSEDERYYNYNFGKKIKKIDLKVNQKQQIGFVSDGHIRNFGIKEAKGKYIAFLDDDDIWLPKKLELQFNALENSNYKMSSTEGLIGEGVYDSSKKYKKYNEEHYFEAIKKKYSYTEFYTRKQRLSNKEFSFPKIWEFDFLKVHNCVLASSVLVEASLLNFLGGFRPIPSLNIKKNTNDYAPDYDCWLGLLRLTSLIYISEPLIYYDDGHGDGIQWN